jgi:hypothetical protein
MRTFIVSRGWQASASIMPAPPPATRFVAAEAGFLPPGPFVDFADMVCFGFPFFLLTDSRLLKEIDGWVSWFKQ